MMMVLRSICVLAIGTIAGVVVWLGFSILLSLVTGPLTIGGGFLSGDSDIMDYVRGGLIVGAIHGLVVSLAILVAGGDSLLSNVVAGLIATEIASGFVVMYFMYDMLPVRHGGSLVETLQGLIIYLLIFSAMAFIPTLLISFAAARAQTLTL